MQAFGHFQVIHHSSLRTWLHAPEWCRSAEYLTAVRRRLAACDGIEDIAVNPATGSVIVRHDPAFHWSTIGHGAWRLDDAPAAPNAAPAPARPRAPASAQAAPARHIARSRERRQPLGEILEELLSLALAGAIARRDPAQIVHDVALSFLCTALRDSRRA